MKILDAIELLARALRAEGIAFGTRWGEPLYELPLYRNRSGPSPTATDESG